MEGFRPYKKLESNESKEVFRASLGFDVIFSVDEDGTKLPYCIEINGSDSGISGMQKIPDLDPQDKLIARIRGSTSPEFERKKMIGRELRTLMKEGTFPVSSKDVESKIGNYIWESVEREKMFTHALTTPLEIENVANNKRLQQEYIPDAYRPRIYDPSSAEQQEPSASGYWMLKPIQGRAGVGIHIVSDKELQSYLEAKDEWFSPYIIQEFIFPSGAGSAPPHFKNHPASLRLLLDFTYQEDGSIHPVYQAAYQRISPFDSSVRFNTKIMEHTFIVNKSRNAISLPATEQEVALARDVALAIIERIGMAYQNSELHPPEASLEEHT